MMVMSMSWENAIKQRQRAIENYKKAKKNAKGKQEAARLQTLIDRERATIKDLKKRME